ncbi:MAG: hypothetical protein N2505_06590 [Endomicrobia bacterium]|nr:hypothetical protein [Endomicrobiia bacterium]
MKKEKEKKEKQPIFYRYKTGEYIREKLGTRHGCIDYRYKKLKKAGRLLLICIRKKEGKRGGKTKAIALLRDINLRKTKNIINKYKVKIKKMKRK